MDINSNKYTYIFAVVMVVLVAALLSIAATSLKPFQDKNVELEKKSDILRSIGVEGTNLDSLFAQYITEQLVIQNGMSVESEVSAFDIDMASAVSVAAEERQVPLYKAVVEENTYYVLPLRGKGLWGPIWGYVALEGDGNTILGATFGHKTETPGLGAEIATPIFQDQFPGKKLFSSAYEGIKVLKGEASGDQEVDGISGGTITSVGVQDMISDCLKPYKAYLLNIAANSAVPTVDTMGLSADTTLITAAL
ncbi:MAG TPA: NADH:ubiquinone reductase (Na(+)-transporting) subunit C [Cryomorphaceae bacterium]|jgi:Na+-transporting NADH:ubiquinone oxidoreductase subunit C|nr:NADH:ubiquinone reductase (Na(+)-transporting) subunit C [Cryomorphaceae bacterium]